MRALLFTHLFPSRYEPTRGVYNLRGFKALASFCDVGIVVPVAAWRRGRRPHDWGRRVVESHEGLSANYPTFWTVPRIMRMHPEAMYRSARARVHELNRERRFDVILGAFAFPDVVAAARLAQELDLPLVAFVLGSDMNELAQRPELRNQIRAALLQAHSVVAVSAGLRSRVLELGIPPDRAIVQHNGVDGERFQIRDSHTARRALGVPVDERVICFVGNLVHEKGPDVLIDAAGRLYAAGLCDLRLLFAGEGPQREELRSKAAALGIGERVTFLGRLSADKVAVCMAAANLLCLPSRREGCPNVVLEALASGRPVVGACVGGVPELLSDRNGIMFPPDDPDALAAAITAALQRSWDPADLRASVPSLTWNDLGRTLHTELNRAVISHGSSAAPTSPTN